MHRLAEYMLRRGCHRHNTQIHFGSGYSARVDPETFLHASMMKIIVNPLGGLDAEPLTLDVDSQATLSDLKALIRESNEAKTNMMLQLVLNTTPLDDSLNGTTLEDNGIKEGRALTVIWRAPVFVLTASNDKTAKIWDAATGECKQTFSGHSDTVWSAAFSADELLVLTASADKTAKIWDAATGECEQTFSGHSSSVTSAAFS